MLTILIATAGSDFWIILHKNNKAKIVGFFYGDESDSQDPKELVESCANFLEEKTTTLEVELEFTEKNAGWELTNPVTGKTYTADCEGDALAELLKEEPNTILAIQAFQTK